LPNRKWAGKSLGARQTPDPAPKAGDRAVGKRAGARPRVYAGERLSVLRGDQAWRTATSACGSFFIFPASGPPPRPSVALWVRACTITKAIEVIHRRIWGGPLRRFEINSLFRHRLPARLLRPSSDACFARPGRTTIGLRRGLRPLRTFSITAMESQMPSGIPTFRQPSRPAARWFSASGRRPRLTSQNLPWQRRSEPRNLPDPSFAPVVGGWTAAIQWWRKSLGTVGHHQWRHPRVLRQLLSPPVA